MYALKYLPNTTYGDLYPRWIIGVWKTRAAAEAVRMQCANTAQIEVVEYEPPAAEVSRKRDTPAAAEPPGDKP